ncbi:3-coathanger stack domain-containing protein [Emticicia sp. BO119]|uniref:Ig-like domain-containing protein n=1 Tax=Emticicia sp. BO119 TaxID=2757768 RepID=UPI0015F0DC47|nr:3-coathanger stack domain-containing protein [Emticicia sp. BO119]MBA4850500.1 hypothetical protein [Emticicia sp. BO119]
MKKTFLLLVIYFLNLSVSAQINELALQTAIIADSSDKQFKSPISAIDFSVDNKTPIMPDLPDYGIINPTTVHRTPLFNNILSGAAVYGPDRLRPGKNYYFITCNIPEGTRVRIIRTVFRDFYHWRTGGDCGTPDDYIEYGGDTATVVKNGDIYYFKVNYSGFPEGTLLYHGIANENCNVKEYVYSYRIEIEQFGISKLISFSSPYEPEHTSLPGGNYPTPTLPTTFYACGTSAVLSSGCGAGSSIWSNGATTSSIQVTGGTYSVQCQYCSIITPASNSCTVILNPIPTSPVFSLGSYLTINTGSDVSIQASCASGTAKWYDATNNVLHNGSTYTKTNITETFSAYVACVANDCESTRNTTTVFVSNGVQSPTLYVPNTKICRSDTRTITALGCTNGVVNWYDASNGGNLLGTGQTFTTPLLTYSNSGSNYHYYYADCTINNTTSSSRSNQYIVVYEIPAPPVTNDMVVTPGSNAVITASGCSGTIYWFANSTITPELSNKTYYITPALTGTTVYYASCKDANCESGRVPVTVTVDNAITPIVLTPSANNFCAYTIDNVVITASNCTGIVRWFETSSSNTSIETDTGLPYEYSFNPYGSTRTIYADCVVGGVATNRKSITIIVKSIPDEPDISPSTYLNINSGSSVHLYATSCPNGIVNWYNAYDGGSLIFTGSQYNQNNVTTDFTLYPDCTIDGCASSRNEVEVNVINSVAAPVIHTSNRDVCGSAAVVLTAVGCSNGTVKWYDNYQGGNLLGTGQAFTTPILTYNTSGSNNYYYYYADCTIGDNTSSRNSKTIYVYAATGTPVGNNITIACNATATLTASGCNTSSPQYESYRWYASATSTAYLSSGTSYTTDNLTTNTIYYVSCRGNGNCESVRAPILVTVQCQAPDAPVISANTSIVCASSPVLLSAIGCAGGIVNWSDNGTGSSRTINPANTLTLTATCTINSLTSENSNILTITVNPKPVLVINNPAPVAPPSTVNITLAAIRAGSTLPGGTTLGYYINNSGTTVLSNPSAIAISGTYYIKATTSSGCIDIKPVIVIINNCSIAITLSSTPDDYNSGTQLKKTNETINAANKVTGTANVTYQSNKSVSLNPGFTADNGTIFKALIAGCN